MDGLVQLAALFASAFLAATVIPAQSEAVLVALHLQGGHSPWLLLAVAGVANTLGSCVNWLLGRFAAGFRDRRWFPVGAAALDRAGRWYGRWGVWSLLASWVPVIGDPLTVAAGLMRTPFALFLALVAAAKFGRYAVLLWLTGG